MTKNFSRRMFLKTTGISAASLAMLNYTTIPAGNSKPNILFIMSDDHAAQSLGCYNSWLSKVVNTPNIDRIAKEGMLFEHCFCTNAICTPSRASILTGKYGHINGCQNLDQDFDGSQQTFPKLLQNAGYHTAVVGKWHLRSEPIGFDYYNILPGQGRYFDPLLKEKGDSWIDGFEGGKQYQGYATDVITNVAIRHLERIPSDKPFCLMLHHKGPHDMWEYDPKYHQLYKNEVLPEPPNLYEDYSGRMSLRENEFKIGAPDFQEYWGDETEHLQGNQKRSAYFQIFLKWFLRCAQSVDDSVGKVLNYLDRKGLAENTIVIYTSDQGAFLGEHGLWDKRLMYEESIRMPFLVRFPGKIKANSRNKKIVRNIDFAPTLLDLAGTDIPEDMQGRSVKPFLENESIDDWDDALYYHYADRGSPPAHLGIRTDRYKLIFYYGLALDYDEGGNTNEELSTRLHWELFDLKNDPHEMRNIYEDPSYRSVRESLRKNLISLKNHFNDHPAILDQIDKRFFYD